TRSDQGNSLVWYVYDDRHLYRPGETLHLKGWIRVADEHSTGDLLPPGQPPQTITYTLKDFQETELVTGSTQTNAYGGFDLELQLPETISTGQTWIEFKTIPTFSPINEQTCTFWHAFQIEEFRRPEFVTSVTSDRKACLIGESAEVTVAANYFAGGPLPGATVNWSVSTQPGTYAPPNWDQFTFGTWIPWWEYQGETTEENKMTLPGKTDLSGKHQIHLDFQSVNPPRPMTVFAEASIADVNRQSSSDLSVLLVHPSSLYVGLKPDRTFVELNHPFSFETIVTDLDGKPQPAQSVTFQVVWLETVYKNKEWTVVGHPVQTDNLISELSPALWQFTPAKGGRYQITAQVVDAQGRPNETQMTLWVAGGAIQRKKGTEEQTLELIPNQKEYQPGETAEILVQSPFVPAQGILTLERSGIVTTERFVMTESSHVLQIPIKETYLPNLHATVYLVGESIREDKDGNPLPHLPTMPVSASGTINLLIPPRVRTLSVTATPAQEQVAPGDETQIAVEVRDAGGNPVDKSECAVVVVDEAILSLTQHIFEHPNDTFYRERQAETGRQHLRNSIGLADESDFIAFNSLKIAGIDHNVVESQVQSLPLFSRNFVQTTTSSLQTTHNGLRA
ncbi:MAG TPA: MG2 domain-containing protein, partial [Acidobacteriota bacterium]|nr:MG2 domain-containing protein [Acidobacteriota bacterium]